MATVTGMTAAAMEAIRDGAIVGADFDSANHLILTKYDGTQLDAGIIGAATTTLAGAVELATSAETQTGTDAVRAVTPAGLASIPGYKVQILANNAFTESADPTGYPYGTSMFSLTTGSGWSINGGFGTVVTESISISRTAQTLYENSGGTASTKVWVREYNNAVGGGGWTAWAQMVLAVRLNEASFSQSTAMASYPSGRSYLYYTTANGGSWDFTGMAGVVETMFLVDKNYATQTFTQHVAGSANTPNVWIRTSDNTTGWSAWKKLTHDIGAWVAYTPTWSTTSGTSIPSFGNAVVNAKAHKIARKVTVQFDIAFGTTTNFGGGGTTDNWTLGLPPAWPASSQAPATELGIGDMYRNGTNLGFTRIKLSGTTAVSFGILVTFVSNALGGGVGGDVDSVTPWTWASADVIRGSFTYESAA
jgi:hypothetical protein